MSNTETQLIALAEAWNKARDAERKANKARIAIENDIIDITGAKEDGRETHHLPDGLKIIVVGKLLNKRSNKHVMAIKENFYGRST